MGPMGCPETSVRNYHYTLCNIPEERSFLTYSGGKNTHTAADIVRVFLTVRRAGLKRSLILTRFKSCPDFELA